MQSGKASGSCLSSNLSCGAWSVVMRDRMDRITRWAKVTHSFEGIHSYPHAPDEVAFLRNAHRHMFHAVVWVEQHHNERDVEYILLKRFVMRETQFVSVQDQFQASCETLAEILGGVVRAEYPGRRIKVEINEDQENGALLEFDV